MGDSINTLVFCGYFRADNILKGDGAMITLLNGGKFLPLLKQALDIVNVESEIIEDKFGFHLDYSRPIHNQWLWAWNMPMTILRAKKLIVHGIGSDTIINKKKYHINAKLIHMRKPRMILSTPNLLNREFVKKYKGRKDYIPFPVDTDKFKPLNTKKTDRVLFWTQMDRKKGFDINLEVAKLRPDLQFEIPDTGWDKGYYKPLLPKNINIIDYVKHEDVPELLNSYRVIIGQFDYDGMIGHSAFETMSCNTPLICGYDKIYNKFYEGDNPCYCSRDPKEIARLIDTVSESDTHKWVKRNFGMKEIGNRFKEVYEDEKFI